MVSNPRVAFWILVNCALLMFAGMVDELLTSRWLGAAGMFLLGVSLAWASRIVYVGGQVRHQDTHQEEQPRVVECNGCAGRESLSDLRIVEEIEEEAPAERIPLEVVEIRGIRKKV